MLQSELRIRGHEPVQRAQGKSNKEQIPYVSRTSGLAVLRAPEDCHWTTIDDELVPRAIRETAAFDSGHTVIPSPTQTRNHVGAATTVI